MVKQTLLAAATALLLASACSSTNDDSAAEASTTTPGGVGVSAADMSTAPDAPANEANNADSLRLRYTVGATYHYVLTQQGEGGPDSASAQTRSRHVYTKRIKAIRSDGSFEVGMTIDTIEVSTEVRRRATSTVLESKTYSSKDSAMRNNPAFNNFNALLGEEVTIILTPQGRIQEMSGITTIVNKLVKDRPEVTSQQKLDLARQIEASVYAQFVEQELIRFPDAPLDSTRSWKLDNAAPVMNILRGETSASYHISAIKNVRNRTVAQIDAKLTGALSALPGLEKAQLQLTVQQGTIAGTGMALVDVATGATLRKVNSITTTVQATVRSLANGQRENISQNSSMQYTVELRP